MCKAKHDGRAKANLHPHGVEKAGPLQMYSVHTDSNRDLRQNGFFLFFVFFWDKSDAPCFGWVPGPFCQAKREGMKGGELPAE